MVNLFNLTKNHQHTPGLPCLTLATMLTVLSLCNALQADGGGKTEIVESRRTASASYIPKKNIPSPYLPPDAVYAKLTELSKRYPTLLHIEEIGRTAHYGLPLIAAKVSDNANQREDEPRALFTGVHHAREPIGANICLAIIETLCREYGEKTTIATLVNSAEIWFVPLVNPDGYKYMFDSNLEFPWWRKNMQDNDGDGVFDPLYDGVDLNRNYDFNWRDGGDDTPGSWFYRGAAAFSEAETEALMKLAKRENFAVGMSYHSYGESVLFPWGNYSDPPDLSLIIDIAQELASRLQRESGVGTYSILPLNGRAGQSSVWMYGELGTIDYIVEVGTQYFPAPKAVPSLLQEHVQAALYLIGRLFDTGVSGHVFDRASGQPLVAVVDVNGFSAEYVRPRSTESEFGSFYHLLPGGVYDLEIRSPGYDTKTISNIAVPEGKVAKVEVALERSAKASNGH